MVKRGRSAIVLFGLLCLLAGVAEAGTTFWLGHTDPPDGLRHKSATLFAEKVKEYTQGRYSVDVHHSSTLGDDPKLLEQVKLGAIDFAVTGVAIYSNQIPELGLLALPYLVESYEQGWALYDTSPWVKEWFAKLQTKNIRYLAMWEAGFRQLTAKRAVRVPEDVKGMKVRISKDQVYLWLWSALGANPTVMALGETYISLQQGVVDAQENPIPTIHVQKFYEVAKNISLTNHIYAPIPLSIGKSATGSRSRRPGGGAQGGPGGVGVAPEGCGERGRQDAGRHAGQGRNGHQAGRSRVRAGEQVDEQAACSSRNPSWRPCSRIPVR